MNVDAELRDKVFHRTIIGKLRTENRFNARDLKKTVIHAWQLNNNLKAQDIKKCLFLFQFSTKRDTDIVLKGSP